MERAYGDLRIPILSWVRDIEKGALEQAKNLTELPFAKHHIALMPDAHQGYGMPIGGVMATTVDVIVPNAVGVDIGCGMLACKLDQNANEVTQEEVKAILGMARQVIPVGFNHNKEKQKHSLFDEAPDIQVIHKQWEKAQYQLGTLGGGNHFIEIQSGSDGKLWLMIHSGSRNFGLKIATEYHNQAKSFCERWYSNIPHKDLSFLPMSEKVGYDYYQAMNFALHFAKANRALMMDRLMDVVQDVLGTSVSLYIDVHHNYAQMEQQFNSPSMVHRKGAILARLGVTGIIPGSQGASSFITEGLGNSDSFHSSSHGAGRNMSRKRAKAELDLEEQIKLLDDLGVVHGIRNVGDLDEAPGAYKDIIDVMSAQADLCRVKVELRPLGVIKA